MEDCRWENLKVLIEDKAIKNGNKSFMLFEDRTISYMEIHLESNILANNLHKLGVKKGENVLVFLFNSPEYLMIWFALAKLGAVMVPINTASRSHDLNHIIENSESETIILETLLLENYLEVKSQNNIKREIILENSQSDKTHEMIPFRRLKDGNSDNLRTDIEKYDPLCIIYTSGTTGKPKGVVLPHFCYINSGNTIKGYEDLKPGDRMFSTLPLFHVGAQLLIAIPSMVADIDFVLMRKFSASRYWDQIRKYNCNIAHYLGSIAQMLFLQPEKPDDADNPAERMIGGGVSKQIWEKFEQRFGVGFIEAYGLTEAGAVSIHNPIDRIKVGSIGLPVAHQRIEIVNQSDETLPPYEHGEIVIRPEKPYTMMLGYFKNPEATMDACRNLWFHTGDIAYRDEEGYIYYVGRHAHFIRRRGENVSSEEVEDIINSHPDVKESGVVGVPSIVGDEDVKAYIVSSKKNLDPLEIIRWCEGKISYFKIPRYVEFLDQLPITATNRLERHKLKVLGIGEAWDQEKSGYKLKK
ncbi:MAG: ATP-dependent acyl-CoA ligase [bacterium]|nr:ATP-dependent acyl-CoA ligase [bacterium]